MQLFSHLWPRQDFEIAKQRPALVLLHGMGGTGALWRPIGAFLEEKFCIIAPDQRGHGKSRPLPSGSTFGPEDFGQDIIETLDQLQISEAFFVGHSMGVRTAAAVAHLQPEKVRGLVLIDLGLQGEAGGGLGQTLRDFLVKLPPHFSDRNSARDWMMQRCPDPAIVQYLMAVSQVDRASGKLTFPFDLESLIATIDAAKNSRIRDWIETAAGRSIPISILRGAQSLVWSHQDFQKEIEHFQLFPLVEFKEFQGAGHGLPFEKRAEFVRHLENFVLQHS